MKKTLEALVHSDTGRVYWGSALDEQDSITRRQRMVRIPITDLTARIRANRRRKVKRWVWRGVSLLVAVAIAVGLVLLCGKGARR